MQFSKVMVQSQTIAHHSSTRSEFKSTNKFEDFSEIDFFLFYLLGTVHPAFRGGVALYSKWNVGKEIA